MSEHGIWFNTTRVLFPAVRSPRAKQIAKAVKQVVAEMPPRKSYCYCGKNCAVNRKHVAMLEMKRKPST